MGFEHIIFDCDGVLVDTEITAAEIMVPVLNTFGHQTTLKHYLSKYTGQTFRGIFNQFNIDDRVDVEMLIKNEEEKVYQNVKPIKGIPELVKKVGRPKSVVSNSGPSQINHAVTSLGLKMEFVHEFSASLVKKPKPAPDVYLHALENLNLPADKCLVIEDSISGCIHAKAADLFVIGFCGGSHITETHGENLKDLGVNELAANADELDKLLSSLL